MLNASSGWGGPPAPPGGGGMPPGGMPPGGMPPGGMPPAPPGGGMPPGGMPPGGMPPGGMPPAPPGGGMPPGGYGYPPGGGYGPYGGGPQGGGYGPYGGGPYGGGPYGGGPYGGGFAPPGGPYAPAPGAVGAWTPTEAISAAWNAIKADFGGVALPLGIGVLVMYLPGTICDIAGRVMINVLGLGGSPAASDMATALGASFGATMGLLSVVSLVNILMKGFMLGGLVGFALKVMRGQKPDFAEVFSGGPLFATMTGAVLLGGLAVGAGSMACLVPGVILAVGWVLYSFLIVDRGTGAVDALKQSWQLTSGHRVNIFVWGLLMFVISLAGTIACLIPALLIAAPLGLLSLAHIYMRIVGEQPMVRPG